MIFLDIETVPDEAAISSRQWAEHKAKKGCDDGAAALSPAFGKVACICAWDGNSQLFRASGPTEAGLLGDFLRYLSDVRNGTLCGHNIKRFDIPFLACRFLAAGMAIPPQLNVAGKKPWEVPHIDTCELLRFGGGDMLSLDAACLMLGIESPKTGDVSAATVWEAYRRGDHDGIAAYCSADVRAVVRLWRRISGFAEQMRGQVAA